MRILFLSTWFPYPPDNGSKIRAYYLLRALANSHSVTAVAFSPPGSEHGQAAGRLDGVRLHAVPVSPFRFVDLPPVVKFASPIPLAFWPSREMRRAVRRLMVGERWDAIVAFQSPVAQYALEAPNIPRVLDVDTALSYQMYERYAAQTAPVGRLRSWVSFQKASRYEKRLFRDFQACTVVSEREVEFIEALVAPVDCRVEVSTNGVDCHHNQPALAEERSNTLVYNGALTYSANYDAMQAFLADSYPLIRRQIPDVILIITGSTEGVNLDALRIDNGVHLTGYLDDVRPCVAGSAACVAPIREGGGTRIKILEAMALGTPVVSTTKGAEGLAVQDGEHLLLADTPDAFAGRTIELLQNQQLRQRLASNARGLVEDRYDWRQIGRRFVDLVEEVASRRWRTGI